MATKKTLGEAESLEQYSTSLVNAENHPVIAKEMAEMGYDGKVMKAGNALFAEAQEAYNANIREDDETSEAYVKWETLKQHIHRAYMLHRKKAKVIFRKDSLVLDRLSVSGSMPKAYVKWLGTVKKFYSVALADEQVQTQLRRLKITLKDIEGANKMIAQLETARKEYLRESGESETATQTKDEAFAKIDDWMSEFYAVAKIAFEDSPQMLEILGKKVKN